MSIPNRQIGWSNESNLLWQIAKQIEYLTKVTATISTEVTVINDVTNPVPVEGPLTNAELRATAVPISAASLPLPTDAATATNQTTANTKLDSVITNTNVTKGSGVIDATTQRVVVATDQIVPVSPRANTTGTNGTTPYKLTSLASTNANVVKNSGGNLYSIIAIGLTSTVRFLKLYNKATTPTVGTDVPVMTIPIPANTQGAGVALPFSMGVNFPLGIGIAITSGSADNDTGAVGAGDVIVNLTYA